MPWFRLINGNCLEEIPKLKGIPINCVLADPPYFVLDEQWDSQWDNVEEYIDFILKYMDLAYDITTDNATLHMFFSQKYIVDILKAENKWNLKKILIWYYPNKTRVFSRKMYLYLFDFILYYVKGNPKFDAKFSDSENKDVFVIAKPQINFKEEYKYHTTTKPVKLLRMLLSPVSDEGYTVLDPFMGSGSTGVACAKLGLNFIGIEINPEFFNIAKKRITEAYNQTRIPMFIPETV